MPDVSLSGLPLHFQYFYAINLWICLPLFFLFGLGDLKKTWAEETQDNHMQ